ncbi:MAG TPA: hypothetical protein VM284_04805 [Candidatus Limnocylindria bacterium]|nr:hypothetical protein [Candidatus Limnocylindria bacterium]
MLLPLTVLVLLGVMPTATAAAADAPNSLGLSATYDVNAEIRWNSNRFSVTSVATVTNSTDQVVDALTFNLVPARLGRLALREVRVGDQGANAQIDDVSLIVGMPVPLDPGAQTTVTIVYDATFNTGTQSKRWLFSKIDNVVTAYRWIPWLSKHHSWSTPNFGETYVTQAASDVRVTFTSDRANVRYATSGHADETDETGHVFVAHNVRDFNFSASTRYKVTSADYRGVSFNFYTLSLSASSLMNLERTAFDEFSDKVGEYPYATLSVAEIPRGGGMESPGMIWIPSNATSAARRRYLVTHETAHQWFYGVVGNDQATDPFADEALAEFLARTVIGFRDSKCAETRLDGTVYDYGSRCYYEVIYIQGAEYLNDYRDRVGNETFWAGLRAYYDRYRFGIGGTYELFQTLDNQAGENGGGHEERFPSLYPHHK